MLAEEQHFLHEELSFVGGNKIKFKNFFCLHILPKNFFQVLSIRRMLFLREIYKNQVGSRKQDMSQTYIHLEKMFESSSVSNKYTFLILSFLFSFSLIPSSCQVAFWSIVLVECFEPLLSFKSHVWTLDIWCEKIKRKSTWK